MTNGPPKPQIRITLEAVLSANGPTGLGFSADVRKLVDGSWEPVVLVNGKPMAPTHSTKEGARRLALTALKNLFGENGYDLAN
jgi:hypothetical protein